MVSSSQEGREKKSKLEEKITSMRSVLKRRVDLNGMVYRCPRYPQGDGGVGSKTPADTKFMDAQVPYIKSCSPEDLPYPRVLHPQIQPTPEKTENRECETVNMEGRVYIYLQDRS